MTTISDVDKSVFENLCPGVHDFNENELVLLQKAAALVKGALEAATRRQEIRLKANG